MGVTERSRALSALEACQSPRAFLQSTPGPHSRRLPGLRIGPDHRKKTPAAFKELGGGHSAASAPVKWGGGRLALVF